MAHADDCDTDKGSGGWLKPAYPARQPNRSIDVAMRDSDGEPCRFLNYYRCDCGENWQDQWSSTPNDRCPRCDSEVEAYKTEQVDG